MENENLRMDAFFDCVNKSERAKARKKVDRKNVVKILHKSLMLFGFGLIMASFGVAGIVANWLSFVAALILSHFSAYYFGRFVAIFKAR